MVVNSVSIVIVPPQGGFKNRMAVHALELNKSYCEFIYPANISSPGAVKCYMNLAKTWFESNIPRRVKVSTSPLLMMSPRSARSGAAEP